MFNDVLYPILFLAIVASGATWTGTNPAYTKHELAKHLTATGATYIITDDVCCVVAVEAAAQSNSPAEVLLFQDLLDCDSNAGPYAPGQICGQNAATPLAHYIQNDTAPGTLRHPRPDQPKPYAALMSTSGTSGQPKIAARTQQALLWESRAIEGGSEKKSYPIRRLICTPVFHAFSLMMAVINALRYGHPSYIMKRFDDSFCQKVFDLEITEITASPGLLSRLSTMKQPTGLLLSNLRLIWCGGTHLTEALRSSTLRMFRNPPLMVQVWGMTEGGWFTTFSYPENDTTGSVGRLIEGWELEMVARPELRTGYEHPVGELYVRGPQLMSGYYRDASATDAALDGGWLRTGDVGYVKDGKVYVVDRTKDLIKVNGFQVSPAELEDAILRHPSIKDCAVLKSGTGVAEHPVAWLVARSLPPSEDEVRQHMYRFLTRYKVSRCRMIFLERIPRGATGKVLRDALRDEPEA